MVPLGPAPRSQHRTMGKNSIFFTRYETKFNISLLKLKRNNTLLLTFNSIQLTGVQKLIGFIIPGKQPSNTDSLEHRSVTEVLFSLPSAPVLTGYSSTNTGHVRSSTGHMKSGKMRYVCSPVAFPVQMCIFHFEG